MAGSEVRIHLSTYLKDAGIKASREQVEKLSRDIQKMNRDAQNETNRTERSLGKLPGAFGKIQDAIGGVGAKALSVIGAFKVGWDIGTWLWEKVIVPIGDVKDAEEELKKHNRELKKQAEEAAKAWEAALAEWKEGWDAQVAGADRAIRKVNDLTKAYLEMQAARERIAAAGDDAKLLGMQRDKFNAMAGAATPEQAAQLGKWHDVQIAEEQAAQGLEKFDRQAERARRQIQDAKYALDEARGKLSDLMQEELEMQKKLEYLESDASVDDLGWDESNQQEAAMRKALKGMTPKLDAAEDDVKRRRAEIAAMEESARAEEQERRNIQERAQLEVDERKKAYDEYVDYVQKQEAAEAEAEWTRQQEEIRKAAELELKERQRIERELAAQRIADLRTELSERQKAESEARSRQSAADGSLSRAWGWYRNQSQMQAVIDERKAQAAAEVQWQKDFDRLKTWRRDWRTAEFGSLSASDEAVRQVAFAKEEKAAADRAVIETAENTRDLAEKLDELIAAK